jgi:hypothetical protein
MKEERMDHATAIATQAAERYCEGKLSEAEREQFEEHFFGCAECAEEVRWEKLFRDQARRELDSVERLAGPEPQFFEIFHLPAGNGLDVYREAGMFALSFDVPPDRRFYSYSVEIDGRLMSSLAAPREPYTTLHLALSTAAISTGEHELTIRGARAAEIARCRFRIR